MVHAASGVDVVHARHTPVGDVTALTSVWSPVDGLFTATVYETVAVVPTGRSPVQVRLGAVKVAVPVVAAAEPNVASSSTPVRSSVNVAPRIGAWPVLVTVTV